MYFVGRSFLRHDLAGVWRSACTSSLLHALDLLLCFCIFFLPPKGLASEATYSAAAGSRGSVESEHRTLSGRASIPCHKQLVHSYSGV